MEEDQQTEKLTRNREHQTSSHSSEASTSTNETNANAVATGDQSKSQKSGESAKDTSHHELIQEETGIATGCVYHL